MLFSVKSTSVSCILCFIISSACYVGCVEWEEQPQSMQDKQKNDVTMLEQAYAPSSSYLKKIEMLTRAEEYISIEAIPLACTDTSIKPKLDYDAALTAGLSEEDADFVCRLLALANFLQENPDTDELDAAFLDPDIQSFFYEYTQFMENQVPALEQELMDDSGFATSSQSIILSTCGNSVATPATCNNRTHHWETWNTEQEVINHLMSKGYHKTAGYTRPSQYDYTRTEWGFCSRLYRTQALIERRGDKWSYNYQRDLNPEVLSAPVVPWPASWWGPYVWWWHKYYC